MTVAAAIVILGGFAVAFIALLGRSGKLPRNRFAGIRTPSTLRSDAAWDVAHRVSWAYTLVSGVGMVILGVVLSLKPRSDVALGVLLLSLVPILIGAAKGDRAARAIVDPQ
ncbi:MAG TPA: SdpI family protein, partial [Actinomycetota bacterium]|nr:SdpI family protein [Actinomycetota bacterium]